MNIKTIANAAAALALGVATWVTPGTIQGQPMYDRVDVNLPYTVTIGKQTLQPGQYVIQQLRDPGQSSRVLLIYSDNGMKFETSAMTIPTLDPNTARSTKIVLHHMGNDYFFDKIWIQGKDYGYEFPLPDSVKARQKEQMQPVSVAANYSTVPAEQTTTAQSTPPATTEPSTPPATQAPVTEPPTQTPTTAQNTMPPATEPATDANRTMPSTSANWLMMLLAGGGLSSAGLMLRRKR